MRTIVATIAVCLVVVGSAVAHPGRTDASGGHHDRKNGGYHTHGGGSGGGGGGASYGFRVPVVRTTPRTTARTEARREAARLHLIERTSLKGDEEKEPERPIVVSRERPVQVEAQQAAYTVFFSDGKTKDILDYKEELFSYYATTIGGGHIRYPKSMVKKIEPIAVPQ